MFADLHLASRAVRKAQRLNAASPCISIPERINPQPGKEKKQPCIMVDRSLEQRNAASECFKD